MAQHNIIREKGEVFKADVMEAGHNRADDLYAMLESAKAEYWALHERLAKEEFTSHWEQIDAVERLGKLGAALKTLGAAYSAYNSVRCW